MAERALGTEEGDVLGRKVAILANEEMAPSELPTK
jgi:hypothetical protein